MADEERDRRRRPTPHGYESEADADLGLIDRIVEQGRLGRDAGVRARGKDLVARFVAEVLAGSITVARDTKAMIDARLAQIDHLLSLQLNEILHHPEFQKLEASWRGLRYLATACGPDDGVTIRVLNVSKRELLKDFQRAPSREESSLFRTVYDEALGLAGRTPFGALMADYDFGASGQDVELLEHIAGVAAAAHAPVLAGAAPELLGLEDFTALAERADVTRAFDAPDHAKWKWFTTTETARYVALVLPRVLLREPYGSGTVPVTSFNCEERVDGTDHSAYLWGNAAWALAARVVRAFATTRWFEDIRGAGRGGAVDGLAVHEFRTESGGVDRKGPTEVPITVRQEQALAGLGLVPLVGREATRDAVFNWVRTVHAEPPPASRTGVARAGVRAFTDLRTMLCACRIAQHLVLLWHATPRGAVTPQTLAPLRAWLASYVHPVGEPGAGDDGSRPLRHAKLEVRAAPSPGGPAVAVLEVWPAIRLDDSGGPVRVKVALHVPAQSAASASWGGAGDVEMRLDAPLGVAIDQGDVRRDDDPDAEAPVTAIARSRDGGGAVPVADAAEEPFALHSAAPSADPDAVLRDMGRALGPHASVLNYAVCSPLTLHGSVAAHRPLAALVEFAAAESSRVELDVTALLSPLLSPATFNRDRLAVLARYPSGAVHGLLAEVQATAGRYVLSLLDPLAILDPRARSERRPTAPLRCEFDIVILEAPAHVG